MNDELEHRVIITESGEQVPVQTSAGVKIELFIPDDPVSDIVLVDIDASQFEELQKQAVTNDIPDDILVAKKAE